MGQQHRQEPPCHFRRVKVWREVMGRADRLKSLIADSTAVRSVGCSARTKNDAHDLLPLVCAAIVSLLPSCCGFRNPACWPRASVSPNPASQIFSTHTVRCARPAGGGTVSIIRAAARLHSILKRAQSHSHAQAPATTCTAGGTIQAATGSQHDNCDLAAVDYDNESEGELRA